MLQCVDLVIHRGQHFDLLASCGSFLLFVLTFFFSSFPFVLDFPFRLDFLFLLEAVNTPIRVRPGNHLIRKSCMFEEKLECSWPETCTIMYFVSKWWIKLLWDNYLVGRQCARLDGNLLVIDWCHSLCRLMTCLMAVREKNEVEGHWIQISRAPARCHCCHPSWILW